MEQNRREDYRKKRARLERERRRKKKLVLIVLIAIAIVVAFAIIKVGDFICQKVEESKIDYSEYWVKDAEDMTIERPNIDVQLLTKNKYSRPGDDTQRIQNIVVHYTANPGTSAQNNRDYFEGLKDSKITSASSNFVIGIEGEIIQCVPTSEIAYASNHANPYSVSIELCHEDETGAFTEATYDSAVALTAYLCDKFDLESRDIIRHYDVTGKLCPLYFVEHEEEFEAFKDDVKKAMK